MTTATESTTGFSDRIDMFLGNFDHTQIVILSYAVSAAILACLVLYIFLNGRHQRAKLVELEKSNLTRANKVNGKNHGNA